MNIIYFSLLGDVMKNLKTKQYYIKFDSKMYESKFENIKSNYKKFEYYIIV
jgi:hypothetical protein